MQTGESENSNPASSESRIDRLLRRERIIVCRIDKHTIGMIISMHTNRIFGRENSGEK